MKPRVGNIDSFCSKLSQSDLKGLLKIPCEHKCNTKHGSYSRSDHERSRQNSFVKPYIRLTWRNVRRCSIKQIHHYLPTQHHMLMTIVRIASGLRFLQDRVVSNEVSRWMTELSRHQFFCLRIADKLRQKQRRMRKISATYEKQIPTYNIKLHSSGKACHTLGNSKNYQVDQSTRKRSFPVPHDHINKDKQ